MRSEKGFTLIEVILAIGIFAIVAVPIVSMFLDGIKITSKSENTSEAYAYAQQYLERMKGGEKIDGETSVVDGKTVTTGEIEGTEYTYKIEMKNVKTQVILDSEKELDGEDFYKYMNTTDSVNVVLYDSHLQINTTSIYDFDDGIIINTDYDWILIGDTTVDVGKKNIWLQYGDLASEKVMKITNESGEEVNFYLQWTGTDDDKKHYLKIKNMGGKVNVYGPVDKSTDEINTEKRGRKQTAEATVIVKNDRTGEHAELMANVTYYE